jgi:hypothetical protein
MNKEAESLLNKLAGMFEMFTQEVRDDVKDIKREIREIKQGFVPRNEFDDLKHRVDALSAQVGENREKLGLIDGVKKNWKFLFCVICITTSIGWCAHAIDAHTIALVHQSQL